MKFKLSTSGYFYPDEYRRKKLEKLGFEFKNSSYKDFHIAGEPEIEINSLEELMEFIDKFGEIIISEDALEIYI